MFLQSDDLAAYPTPAEILSEIGWVLAVRLSIAAVTVLTPQAFRTA